GPAKEVTNGARLLIDRLLDWTKLGALVREIDRPGRQISGDIAFGNAAHRHGPMLGELVAAKAVAKGISAGRQTDGKNRHRAQKDGAAVLQLLDHGNIPCVHRKADDYRTLSPVTAVDEPCIYSDELSKVK